jgi:hypothetical protein
MPAPIQKRALFKLDPSKKKIIASPRADGESSKALRTSSNEMRQSAWQSHRLATAVTRLPELKDTGLNLDCAQP